MKIVNKPKVVAGIATIFCVASLLGIVGTHRVNRSLESGLEREKLKSEALLSEKLLLEKDFDKTKEQLSRLRAVNGDLNILVRKAEGRLMEQEADLKRLKKENTSLTVVRRQREQLKALQHDLEEQLQAAKKSLFDLQRQNDMLSSTIVHLQEQNRILSNDLDRMMLASMDRLQVQAVKGRKDRLTVRARKADKLIADFEVPGSLQNISYRVLDPTGSLLTEKHGVIIAHAKPSQENLMASASNGAISSPQKIHMEYLPKVKLRPGIYTVEILNDNLYVSSLNVKLR